MVHSDLNPEMMARRSVDRTAKFSTQYGSFYNTANSGVVSGSGIDAKDFLKFYI